MKVLELFSGTHSVGKVCQELGHTVISLDLKDADINCDILNWNYREYPSGYFDMIWASPPCNSFSLLMIARLKTKEKVLENINKTGLPILRKTQEIIDYFKPKYFFIENPKTGNMKDYISDDYYDVDYCRYCDWGYRKTTRIWTNLKDFTPKRCNKECGNMVKIGDHHFHRVNLGNSKIRKILLDNGYDCNSTQAQRYRIPPNLIKELMELINY
jgi:hypothetical protein